jgi:hypothetical protein
MLQVLQYLAAVSVSGVLALAPAGPWDAFNLAPASRVVWPTAIHGVTGTVDTPENLIGDNGFATISGNGSFVTLDYGKEVLFLSAICYSKLTGKITLGRRMGIHHVWRKFTGLEGVIEFHGVPSIHPPRRIGRFRTRSPEHNVRRRLNNISSSLKHTMDSAG